MAEDIKNALYVERLSDEGKLTIPAEYRDAHALSENSTVILVQVGDALVITPYDDDLATVTGRLESAMREAGLEVDELIEEAANARSEIAREEFGGKDNQ